MNLEYAKDPRWSDESHTAIDLTAKWAGLLEEHAFTASPTDVAEHGRVIFNDAVAGRFGEVKEHEPPLGVAAEPTTDMAQIFPTPSSGSIGVTTFE